MEDSVFTKMVKGEIPCRKVYESDKNIVIIPLHLTAKGKVLVIPKVQVDQFHELPDEDYRELWSDVKMIAKHMTARLGTSRIGIKVEGLGVPHVHVHVIAFDNQAEFDEKEDESLPPDNEKADQLLRLLDLT